MKKPLPDVLPRWVWRLALLAVALATFGYFSTPTVSPLMCKIYG